MRYRVLARFDFPFVSRFRDLSLASLRAGEYNDTFRPNRFLRVGPARPRDEVKRDCAPLREPLTHREAWDEVVESFRHGTGVECRRDYVS